VPDIFQRFLLIGNNRGNFIIRGARFLGKYKNIYNAKKLIISGFQYGVNRVFALLGCYTVLIRS